MTRPSVDKRLSRRKTGAVRPAARSSAERYVRGMKRLIEVVPELSLARSLDAVMAIVRTAARQLTGADGATFVLRDGDLCYYADEDAVAPLWKGRRFPMSACISGWVMRNGTPALIPDVYDDPRVPVDAYRPTFVKSLVMVPIRSESPIGAIGNYWAAHHRASDEELGLLQALAHSTSIALENIDLASDLERRVVERTDELNRANVELSAANEALNRLQRQKEELASLLVHDLRSPAAAIVMRAQLRLEEPGLSERERRAWIHELAAGEAIGRMATNLIDVVRADTGRLTVAPEPLELRGLVREITGFMSASAEGRNVEIKLDLPAEEVELVADRELVSRVLQNLVDNGLRYSPPGSVLRIEVRGSDAEIEIGVRDSGPGIPPELREQVFERYVRLPDSGAAQAGRGLGLALCRLAVEAHGGRIWVEENRPRGTCFRLRLPRRAAGGVREIAPA